MGGTDAERPRTDLMPGAHARFSLEGAVCEDSYRRQCRERSGQPIAPTLACVQTASVQTAFSPEKIYARGLGVTERRGYCAALRSKLRTSTSWRRRPRQRPRHWPPMPVGRPRRRPQPLQPKTELRRGRRANKPPSTGRSCLKPQGDFR